MKLADAVQNDHVPSIAVCEIIELTFSFVLCTNADTYSSIYSIINKDSEEDAMPQRL